jgi:hypothetical protein
MPVTSPRMMVALLLSCCVVALLGMAFIVNWLLMGGGRNAVVELQVATPPLRQISPTSQPTSRLLALPPDKGLLVAFELHSSNAERRADGVRQLSALAVTDPRSLAISLPGWIDALVATNRYEQIDRLTYTAILERPYDTDMLKAAQRARVMAFLNQGKDTEALVEARRYYNVAPLAATNDAVALVFQLLAKTAGLAVASEFQEGQAIGVARRVGEYPVGEPERGSDSPPPLFARVGAQNPLQSIQVGDLYASAIASLKQRSSKKGYSATNLLARGNLLLLSNRADQARAYFLDACRSNGVTAKYLRIAIEGVARSIRAEDCNASRANAFIVDLRRDPSRNPLGGDPLFNARGFPTPDDVRDAAQRTQLADLDSSNPPPLEATRATAEDAALGVEKPIEISTGFECSTPINVETLSPTHFRIELTTSYLLDWFMFKVQGAAGKIVRIDIENPGKPLDKWLTLNPVYTDAESIDDPKTFAFSQLANPPTANLAWNGSLLPPSAADEWHYIGDVWQEADNSLSFVNRFDSDSVFIAMRVPYSPGYNEQYMQELKANPFAKVIDVGRSPGGRPLTLVQLGHSDPSKPCLLFYAGEHADEYDACWIGHFIIKNLLSGGAPARQLLDRFTFLVIPQLDPDSSFVARHEGIIASFLPGVETPEAIAYANWFRAWVKSGNRLDAVFDFHNVQSEESPQVACAMIEGLGTRGHASAVLHQAIVNDLIAAGFSVTARPWMRGWMPDRLGGWLSRYYGPLTFVYELNSQSPDRHLSLSDLNGIASVFLDAVGAFYSGHNADAVTAEINERRAERTRLWRSDTTVDSGNAIQAEARLGNHRSNGGDSLEHESSIP